MFSAGYTQKNTRPKRSVRSRTISDYSPFGVLLPERAVNAGGFRYGFNEMEGDSEVKGEGNSYTTEFRQYDPRLGRWLSLDPLMYQFPWQSPYVAIDNNPIGKSDPKGSKSEWKPVVEGNKLVAQKEKGDDAKSLAEFLDVSQEKADELFAQMDKKGQIDIIGIHSAGVINGAIYHSNNYPDEYKSGLFGNTNYNCHESSLSCLNVHTIDFEDNYTDGHELRNILSNHENGYEDITKSPDDKDDSYVFSQTLITFEDKNENTVHSATYLGTSRDGTMYVWTKDGNLAKPKISTANKTEKRWKSIITGFYKRD